jgi:hypothetical protein
LLNFIRKIREIRGEYQFEIQSPAGDREGNVAWERWDSRPRNIALHIVSSSRLRHFTLSMKI